MNSTTKRNNIAIPSLYWELLQEQFGHITPSKSAQLRLVLHLWASPILEERSKEAQTKRALEGV